MGSGLRGGVYRQGEEQRLRLLKDEHFGGGICVQATVHI